MHLIRRWLCLAVISSSAALAACRPEPPAGWPGYVEGDYLYIASPIGGTLRTLAVRRGSVVAQDAPLFALDDEAERAARDEAAARLAAANAQAADTTKGRRSDEVAVTRAQLAQARVQADLAAQDFARQRQLIDKGFLSPAALDASRTAAEQARQRVAELEASLRVARLPGRMDERIAASASAQAASEAVRQVDWRARQMQRSAPAAGRIADTFFRVGESVQAGQPVVSLLPPGNIRVRFFVPEAEIGGIGSGQPVTLACDGCGAAIAARIDFIATQAEYTPPVIYSNAQRARLVFMVEARPDAKDAERLHPGQPVDVRRASR